jgi:hypothetical protein
MNHEQVDNHETYIENIEDDGYIMDDSVLVPKPELKNLLEMVSKLESEISDLKTNAVFLERLQDENLKQIEHLQKKLVEERMKYNSDYEELEKEIKDYEQKLGDSAKSLRYTELNLNKVEKKADELRVLNEKAVEKENAIKEENSLLKSNIKFFIEFIKNNRKKNLKHILVENSTMIKKIGELELEIQKQSAYVEVQSSVKTRLTLEIEEKNKKIHQNFEKIESLEQSQV